MACSILFLDAQRILEVGSGKSYSEPRSACLAARPGDTVLIYPGTYSGGYFIENLKGTSRARITIKGTDATTVVFSGSSEALHFIEAEYVNLMNITVTRQTGNGINMDDGGTYETPSKHILIQGVIFKDMNATGNNDMLKLSGIDSFEIRNCTLANGSTGGSGIDMVGCHWGYIHHNSFLNQGSNSIQAKGGSHNIIIEANKFTSGGARTLNLGGSTGQAFFRPLGVNYEAKDIRVNCNFFQGSDAPIAYVGSRNVVVSNNTFVSPGKWIFRILQESSDTNFYQSSANNTFRNNIIFVTGVNPTVNIGPNTSPGTYKIENNLWFSQVDANWRGPTLPVTESNPITGRNPLLVNLNTGNIDLMPNSPAIGKGKGPVSFLDYSGRQFKNPPSIGATEYYINTAVEDILESKVMEFYPNPAKDEIVFQNSELGCKVEIINSSGNKVLESSLDEKNTIVLSKLTTGVYFVRIILSQGKLSTQKLIKL